MSIPYGIIWGNPCNVGTNKEARIGIEFNILEDNFSYINVIVGIYYWTKYNMNESFNLYYEFSQTANILQSIINVSTPSNIEWSESNKYYAGSSYKHSFTKTFSETVEYFSVKFIDDTTGNSITETFSFTIDSLPHHDITYDYNDDRGIFHIQLITDGDNTIIIENIPQKDHYIFLGWSLTSTDNTPQYHPNDIIPFSSNVTLYAIWEQIKIMIELNPNGGVVEQHYVEIGHGDSIGYLPNATKDNEQFSGWNTKPDGTGIWITENTVMYESIIIYAVWGTNRNLSLFNIYLNGSFISCTPYIGLNGVWIKNNVYIGKNCKWI